MVKSIERRLINAIEAQHGKRQRKHLAQLGSTDMSFRFK
jgi:hypothetical protein